ncbi:MAG: hypothetical protein ACHQ2Z_16825 [Elusimicrobiota bacterium]
MKSLRTILLAGLALGIFLRGTCARSAAVAASAEGAIAANAGGAAAAGSLPVIVPALNFSFGFGGVFAAGSLAGFSRELSLAAEPSRAKSSRAADPLRLASLSAIVDAALSTKKEPRSEVMSAVKAGVSGNGASRAVANLRAAIKREG